MTRTSSDFNDVPDMFRLLAKEREGSVAYTRQRDAIIKRCLPLADNVARRFAHRGEPFDDLVQVARVGLIKAVSRFDVDAGADFLSFAVPTVMGEVRRHFRDHGWALRVPRRLKDLHLRLGKAIPALSQELRRAPTATEVADYLGVERSEVIEAVIAGSNYATLSTDAPSPGNHAESLSLGEAFGCPDDNLDNVIDIESVRPALDRLPEREQMVLRLRFFEELTQSQIAKAIGVSQMHVSRMLTKTLAALRADVLDGAAIHHLRTVGV